MTRIRAACPTCGDVDLDPEQVRLRRELGGGDAAAASYRFRCPACAHEVVKEADARVVSLLATGGVTVEDVPTLARSGAPAFTVDDVLDLHLALREPDWFDRFAGGVART